MPAAAEFDLRLPAQPRQDSAPTRDCERPESADAAGQDEATDPNRDRTAPTLGGLDDGLQSLKTGLCVYENLPNPVPTTGRAETRAWCSCPGPAPRIIPCRFPRDQTFPAATFPAG